MLSQRAEILDPTCGRVGVHSRPGVADGVVNDRGHDVGVAAAPEVVGGFLGRGQFGVLNEAQFALLIAPADRNAGPVHERAALGMELGVTGTRMTPKMSLDVAAADVHDQ